MFNKLDSIDFEILKNLNFEFPKWKSEFNSYFWVMEKIYNLYLDLKEYETLLNASDKKTITADLNIFTQILSNIQNNNWKKPDWRLKNDKFNQSYINWLSARKLIYEHFKNLLNSKEEENKKIIEKKDEIINDCKEDLEITENQKKEKEEELNKIITTLKTEKIDLSKSIKELKDDIADKELNKLALAFWKEESKYFSWSKKMIYIWFSILCISPISIIILYLIDLFFLESKYQEHIYIISIPLLVLTLIWWYFLYFQLKNYYINRDLETNFANRKAVANSFKWLLEMVNEEENFWDTTELKSKFFDKVSSILYAEIDTSNIKKHSDDVPISKLLDTINELIKKLN